MRAMKSFWSSYKRTDLKTYNLSAEQTDDRIWLLKQCNYENDTPVSATASSEYELLQIIPHWNIF